MPPLIHDPFAIESPDELLTEGQRRKRSGKPVKFYATIQGNFVKFKMSGGLVHPPPDRTGTHIGMMSKASRLKLLSLVNRMDWRESPVTLFVTLTYPDTIVHRDYDRRSRDRAVWMRYIEKHLGRKVPSIWRVEWMPRKSGEYIGRLMPHWHLLLPNTEFLSKYIVREWWRRAIGHDSTYLDVHVKRVIGVDGAIRYLAKYVSKQAALGIVAYHNSGFRFGRHWGCTRKDLLPMCPIDIQRELHQNEIEAVRGMGATMNPHYEVDSGAGYTLLGKAMADFWREFLNDT